MAEVKTSLVILSLNKNLWTHTLRWLAEKELPRSMRQIATMMFGNASETRGKSETGRLSKWSDPHLEGTLWPRSRCVCGMRQGSPSCTGKESEHREWEDGMLALRRQGLPRSAFRRREAHALWRGADNATTLHRHQVAPFPLTQAASTEDRRTMSTLSNVPGISRVGTYLIWGDESFILQIKTLWEWPGASLLVHRGQRVKNRTVLSKPGCCHHNLISFTLSRTLCSLQLYPEMTSVSVLMFPSTCQFFGEDVFPASRTVTRTDPVFSKEFLYWTELLPHLQKHATFHHCLTVCPGLWFLIRKNENCNMSVKKNDQVHFAVLEADYRYGCCLFSPPSPSSSSSSPSLNSYSKTLTVELASEWSHWSTTTVIQKSTLRL